ncbi:MAG: hypothetical protein H7843_11160 [Nitrospirota bacterium]
MSILLINPPFGSFMHPYMSIPALTPYLRAHGIETTVFDANIEFYHDFLQRDNIIRGVDFAFERIEKLNTKGSLRFDEKIEYMHLVKAWQALGAAPEDILAAWEQGSKPAPSLLNSILAITASRFFPEQFDTNKEGFLDYKNIYDEFTSADVLKGSEAGGLLSGFYEKVLPCVIGNKKPLIAGISICFQGQFLSAFRCARALRRLLPELHITIGGPFVSCFMRNVRNPDIFGIIDSIVLDSGEAPLVRLHHELSGVEVPDFSKIPGLIYLSDGGRITANPPEKSPAIEMLPTPDYNVFNLRRYFGFNNGMWLSLRLSRGCYWARCSFCRSRLPMVSDYRQPEAGHSLNSILKIKEETGVDIFHFIDEACEPRMLEALSRGLIDKKAGIKWFCHLKADPLIDLGRLMLYREAGCSTAVIGLESYNDRILKLMQKGTKVSILERILPNFKWAGINVFAYMITGFPTETEEEAAAGFDKITELTKNNTITNYLYNTFFISYGSPIYYNPEKYGITSIDRQDERDLDPGAANFSSPGMTRKAARLLTARFNIPLNKSHSAHADSIEYNSQSIRLKVDISEIEGLILNGTDLSLPYGAWLRGGSTC